MSDWKSFITATSLRFIENINLGKEQLWNETVLPFSKRNHVIFTQKKNNKIPNQPSYSQNERWNHKKSTGERCLSFILKKRDKMSRRFSMMVSIKRRRLVAVVTESTKTLKNHPHPRQVAKKTLNTSRRSEKLSRSWTYCHQSSWANLQFAGGHESLDLSIFAAF